LLSLGIIAGLLAVTIASSLLAKNQRPNTVS
jgi:hypothetical protein